MHHKPINNTLKAYFNNIYEQAKNKARTDFDANIANKTTNLNGFEALKLYIKENDNIKALIEKDKHPYYVKNHSTENWLLTQFASRYFLLGEDESQEFINSVYLGEYQSLLFTQIHNLEKEIPQYTFQQFLNGEKCKYYFQFDESYNIEREDYYDILEWQSNSLIDIVSNETVYVINRYQEKLKTIDNPLDFIAEEFRIIEDELLPEINNAKTIKTILSKLFLFNEFDLKTFEDEKLLKSYALFHGTKVDFKKITPESVGNILTKLKQPLNGLIGNEYTIFYTIENLAFWLEDVIKGKSHKQVFSFPNWKQELEEAIEKGKKEADTIQEEISDFAYLSNHSKKEIKTYLFERFEEYRTLFNNFEPKQVFALLKEDSQKALYSSFKVNCFFNNDDQKFKDDLTEAVKIDAVLWEVTSIYYDIFDSKTFQTSGNNYATTNIMFLLHQMVLDKEIYNELQQSLDDFMQHFHSLSLPFPLHIENSREQFARLFHKGISRLQEVLNEAEPTKKMLYLQSRIKELRQREFQMTRYREMGYGSKGEEKYPKLLREFLNIETDFIRETSAIKEVVVLEQPQPKLLAPKKIDNLDDLLSKDKVEYILNLFESIGITQDNKSTLGTKRKGAIRGIVEALREKGILHDIDLHKLIKLVAKKIELEIASKLDASNTSHRYYKITLDYIKSNPFK
tara:strand:+ start:183 stop:2228 length:2046 start_codon:yes stop_codon:yes gene_type:complete